MTEWNPSVRFGCAKFCSVVLFHVLLSIVVLFVSQWHQTFVTRVTWEILSAYYWSLIFNTTSCCNSIVFLSPLLTSDLGQACCPSSSSILFSMQSSWPRRTIISTSSKHYANRLGVNRMISLRVQSELKTWWHEWSLSRSGRNDLQILR